MVGWVEKKQKKPATAPAIPLLEKELAKAKAKAEAEANEAAESMDASQLRRVHAITADDPANLPLAYHDVVRVHGLERRTDLNNRLAEAHGRVRKQTQDREGITMLLGGESVWIRRRNLQSLRTPAILNQACDEHGVADAERRDALLQMGVERRRIDAVVDDYGATVGGVYRCDSPASP